jgi:ABC-type sulfate/molybdate transport systems ATPase subunit
LRRASELTLVHVTHDPAEVAANCTALVRLERGAVVAA